MENIKTLINKKPFIIYEYHCSICEKFFWTSIPKKELTCPFCNSHSYINGEIPIKNMEIDEKKREDIITKI